MVKGFLARRRSAKQTKLDHERLTSLVNSMADGVLAVDKNMQVVLSNGAALEILDVNSSLQGRRLHEVLRVQYTNSQPVNIEKLVAETTTPSRRRDLLLPYSDGSKVHLYLSVAPVHVGYGRLGQYGFVLVMRDITHEKSLEEERDEFISVVSHELRTPLAIAEGNISNAQFIVEKSGDTRQVKSALLQAHDQIMFLSGLVNDLSMLSRAEHGKLSTKTSTFDIRKLMHDLATNYTPVAKAKGLQFTLKLDDQLGTLTSSKLYVREMLQNFITNAIKYTESGGIQLMAEATEQGVRFRVQDSGIGISKRDQTRLFDKFFRSEDYRTRKTNGTGLGLYVTRKLSHLVHAQIDVQSELNKGSTFTLFVPNLQ